MNSSFHGKVLEIDLARRKYHTVEVAEESYRKYLGGSALACLLTMDRLAEAGDPYSPQNALTFMAGPFTASGLTSTGRHTMTALSPLTGCWGEATGGGLLARNLQGCGVDGVIITGKSESPVYLFINEEGVEFREATHIWGKTTFETFDAVREETQKNAQVAAIGPAGENLVRYACVVRSGGGVAGRCGMGAVMGDKNLKAVAFRGRSYPGLANPDVYKFVADQVYNEVDLKADMLREYGTLGYIDVGMYFGDVPARYFTGGVFPVEKISAAALRQKYLVEARSCCYCAISCKRKTSVKDNGEFTTNGPEYESAVSLGPLMEIYDLETICRANLLSDTYGMDTISLGVSLSFAAYLLQQGLVSEKDLGFSVSFGDEEGMLEMIRRIAYREEGGELLAEGVRIMAEKLGAEPGLAAHVKGLEVPMHEPRAFEGQALCYATGPRGACHQKADFYMVDLGQLENPEEMDLLPGDRFNVKDRVKQVVTMQDYRELFNNLVMCNYASLPLSILTSLITGATGWELTPEEVLDMGRKSIDIKKDLNCRLGVKPEDDRLPSIVCRPLPDGGAAGKELDMEPLLQEYYRERQWDPETGRPQRPY